MKDSLLTYIKTPGVTESYLIVPTPILQVFEYLSNAESVSLFNYLALPRYLSIRIKSCAQSPDVPSHNEHLSK